MKFRLLLLVLVLGLLITPALAQEGTPSEEIIHTLVYDQVSFQYSSLIASGLIIESFAGDPPDAEYPGGPIPPLTRFSFIPPSDSPEVLSNVLPPQIEVYDLAAMRGYTFYENEVAALQTLLNDRPDLAPYMQIDPTAIGSGGLPSLPVYPAAQVFRAQAVYLQNEQISGLRYLTHYAQAVDPVIEGTVFYNFFGITANGQYAVSVRYPLITGILPTDYTAIEDYEAFAANFPTYLSETVAAINALAPEAFSPPLALLDAVALSVGIG